MNPAIVGNFRFKPAEIGRFAEAQAEPAVAGLKKGAHIIGLTMGAFSLIDLIHATLKKTGPADVYIATWSAGIKDAHQVRWMVDTEQIRRIALLTDHSYVNRQKRYAASIEQLFGKENIRCAEMHAKFVVIQNDDWDVTILSSMNLNANRTCESFTIYEDEDITSFHLGFIKKHFSGMGDGWESSGRRVSKTLKAYFREHDAEAEAERNHWSEL